MMSWLEPTLLPGIYSNILAIKYLVKYFSNRLQFLLILPFGDGPNNWYGDEVREGAGRGWSSNCAD